MTAASLALRVALWARLSADAPLAAMLGGPRVYDEPPRGAAPPYVVLANVETRDASGDEAPVEEHEVALEVWSREGGLSEALKAADRVVRVVDGAALDLDGHRLAGLAWIFTDAGRPADAGLRLAKLKFRAVTEPSIPSPLAGEG